MILGDAVAPCAAMDEHEDRRLGAPRAEDVELLDLALAIGEALGQAQPLARRLAAGDAARGELRLVGRVGGLIVGGVELALRIVEIDAVAAPSEPLVASPNSFGFTRAAILTVALLRRQRGEHGVRAVRDPNLGARCGRPHLRPLRRRLLARARPRRRLSRPTSTQALAADGWLGICMPEALWRRRARHRRGGGDDAGDRAIGRRLWRARRRCT